MIKTALTGIYFFAINTIYFFVRNLTSLNGHFHIYIYIYIYIYTRLQKHCYFSAVARGGAGGARAPPVFYLKSKNRPT